MWEFKDYEDSIGMLRDFKIDGIDCSSTNFTGIGESLKKHIKEMFPMNEVPLNVENSTIVITKNLEHVHNLYKGYIDYVIMEILLNCGEENIDQTKDMKYFLEDKKYDYLTKTPAENIISEGKVFSSKGGVPGSIFTNSSIRESLKNVERFCGRKLKLDPKLESERNICELEDENSILKSEIDPMKSLIDELDKEICKYRIDTDLLKKRICELEFIIDARDSDINHLREGISGLHKNLSLCAKEKKDIRENNSYFKQENSNYVRRFYDAVSEINRLEIENNTLKAEKEIIKEDKTSLINENFHLSNSNFLQYEENSWMKSIIREYFKMYDQLPSKFLGNEMLCKILEISANDIRYMRRPI